MSKKVIRLTENDLERLVKKIIKEEGCVTDYMAAKKGNLLTYVLNTMIESGMVDEELVNVENSNFEVYGFENTNFGYFMDNFIKFEIGGPNEIFLNFEMYEEDIDMREALEVSNWLYPKLNQLFGGKIDFFDNLDDDM